MVVLELETELSSVSIANNSRTLYFNRYYEKNELEGDGLSMPHTWIFDKLGVFS